MYEPMYYPLIDMDTSGNEKTAMIGTNHEATVKNRGIPYLSEIVAHTFRAHGVSKDQNIHCPYCGNVLKAITNETTNALYICKKCGF